MKKIFTLIAMVAAFVAGAQAQTITINKTDGQKITYDASEVQSIEFGAKADTDKKGAYKLAGTYTGTDSLVVAAWKYQASGSPEYKITAVSADTINVTVPEEKVMDTMMGDLTLSSYTINNLVWDATQNAYVRNYKDDGIKFHFKAEGGSLIDDDYTLGRDREGNPSRVDVIITVKPNDDGTVYIDNKYGMGNMPLGVENRFHSEAKK